MMKKLMVLALVMGVASLANAAWSIEVAADNTSATIFGDYLNVDIYYGVFSTKPIVIELGSGAPDASQVLDSAEELGLTGYDPALKGVVWTIASYTVIPNKVGVPMFLISGIVAPETISVRIVDGDTAVVGDTVVEATIIPEPATMLLLGLGGLLLRRK
ncbi:MAG TPA: PEP-CTERM sorting domain-containing protein [Anaerohalosphaeraceae bacterium]|nr:PEP-CTERM sorting domain-containing protein [Anaerohalosphaeraceae bacterium]